MCLKKPLSLAKFFCFQMSIALRFTSNVVFTRVYVRILSPVVKWGVDPFYAFSGWPRFTSMISKEIDFFLWPMTRNEISSLRYPRVVYKMCLKNRYFLQNIVSTAPNMGGNVIFFHGFLWEFSRVSLFRFKANLCETFRTKLPPASHLVQKHFLTRLKIWIPWK